MVTSFACDLVISSLCVLWCGYSFALPGVERLACFRFIRNLVRRKLKMVGIRAEGFSGKNC